MGDTRHFVRGEDFVYNVDHIVGVRIKNSGTAGKFNVEGTVVTGDSFLFRENVSPDEARTAVAKFASIVAEWPEARAIHTSTVFNTKTPSRALKRS